MGTESNTNQDVIATPSAPEKTFTQADVDRIVTNRVAKYSDYEELKAKAAKFDEVEEANKTELQKAIERANTLQAKIDGMEKENTIRKVREEVSQTTGVPASLLTGTTAEECEAQAKAIAEYKAESHPSYPAVKDASDPHINTKKTTRDQFADWLNKQV